MRQKKRRQKRQTLTQHRTITTASTSTLSPSKDAPNQDLSIHIYKVRSNSHLNIDFRRFPNHYNSITVAFRWCSSTNSYFTCPNGLKLTDWLKFLLTARSGRLTARSGRHLPDRAVHLPDREAALSGSFSVSEGEREVSHALLKASGLLVSLKKCEARKKKLKNRSRNCDIPIL